MKNLYGDLEKAIAGQKFGLDAETESFAAGENIYPGDPIFGMVGDDKVCYGAHISAVALTAGEDLVTGNSIVVTVNDIELEPVAFENNSVATIRKIVAAIDQNEEVRALGVDAYFSEGFPRAISLQGPGITITASAVVTGGATQATFTPAALTNSRFMGVARFEELGFGKDVGFFPAGISVPVQTRGKVFVPVADSAAPDDKKPAYVILSGEDAGKFTDVALSNYDCGCFFRGDRISGNLALIELRGMK
jgi:hypothetical protein